MRKPRQIMLAAPSLRSPISDVIRSPFAVGTMSLVQQAIAILRKYGTDAHIYLPGIGTISGLTAGNYLDSAGTTAATVDNPVGLSLDALQAMTLGAELLSQSNATLRNNVAPVFDSLSGTTFSNVSDKVSVGYDSATIPVIAGNSYNITIQINVATGLANLSLRSGGALGAEVASTSNYPAGVATWTTVFYATVTESLTLRISTSTGSGATSVSISTRSIKQIPGIHAKQATTANKPILRQSAGKYSWQFDGVNDSLSLSGPLFQMSDDHAVIAGFKADTANKYLFSQVNSGTSAQCCSLRVDVSGLPGVVWIDDAAANTLLYGPTSCIGSNTVASAIKIGNAKRLRVNGVQSGATDSTVLGASTTNTYSIGAILTNSFQGSIYPIIAIKGTVTDSDLLVLERFVGQLSGVTI